jgi:hypothetical protein
MARHDAIFLHHLGRAARTDWRGIKKAMLYLPHPSGEAT